MKRLTAMLIALCSASASAQIGSCNLSDLMPQHSNHNGWHVAFDFHDGPDFDGFVEFFWDGLTFGIGTTNYTPGQVRSDMSFAVLVDLSPGVTTQEHLTARTRYPWTKDHCETGMNGCVFLEGEIKVANSQEPCDWWMIVSVAKAPNGVPYESWSARIRPEYDMDGTLVSIESIAGRVIPAEGLVRPFVLKMEPTFLKPAEAIPGAGDVLLAIEAHDSVATMRDTACWDDDVYQFVQPGYTYRLVRIVLHGGAPAPWPYPGPMPSLEEIRSYALLGEQSGAVYDLSAAALVQASETTCEPINDSRRTVTNLIPGPPWFIAARRQFIHIFPHPSIPIWNVTIIIITNVAGPQAVVESQPPFLWPEVVTILKAGSGL